VVSTTVFVTSQRRVKFRDRARQVFEPYRRFVTKTKSKLSSFLADEDADGNASTPQR
jgi:hypothetical protein